MVNLQPCIVIFTNEPGVEGYSGQIANPLTPELAKILARIAASNAFNAILINRYKSKELEHIRTTNGHRIQLSQFRWAYRVFATKLQNKSVLTLKQRTVS